MPWTYFEWPEVGRLALTASAAGLREIRFDATIPAGENRDDSHPFLRETSRQLASYFGGDLRRFELPLDMRGTDFQRRVWTELIAIPYGQTRAYRQIANSIGAPLAVRAVGAANGRNPIPIVVPCHRVIGASGKLVGFGGGLPLKRLLLDLESSYRLP